MSLKPDLGQESFFDTQTLCANLLPAENFFRHVAETVAPKGGVSFVTQRVTVAGTPPPTWG